MKAIASFISKNTILVLGLSLLCLCNCRLATASNLSQASFWKTRNGTKVVFHQTMEVPMVELRMAFAAGSAYDGAQFGIADLCSHLINQGNGDFTASELAEKISNIGAQFDSKTERDMVIFKMKTLSNPQTLKEAGDLLALTFSKPQFPMDAFLRVKNQQLMSIAQEDETPPDVAKNAFYKTLYQQHPYAHRIKGNPETLKNIDLEQVKNFYKQYYVANNAVLVLVGALDEKAAKALAEQITANLPAGQAAAPLPIAKPLTEEVNLLIQYPSSQAVLYLGQLGINHSDPDYFPLIVGNYTLGGGTLVSRLALEVREKRGLTYGIYSQFEPMPGIGPFIISLSTANKQANEALQITEETLNSFLKTGPNQEELAAAKQFINGSFPVSLASNEEIANILLKISFYNLPNNYLDTYLSKVNAVSAEEIRLAFQKLIQPNKMVQVSVGNL